MLRKISAMFLAGLICSAATGILAQSNDGAENRTVRTVANVQPETEGDAGQQGRRRRQTAAAKIEKLTKNSTNPPHADSREPDDSSKIEVAASVQ